MTDTPAERIWVTGNAEMTTGSWNSEPVRHHSNPIEYTLTTTHEAAISPTQPPQDAMADLQAAGQAWDADGEEG